jgi:hypothetical protein
LLKDLAQRLLRLKPARLIHMLRGLGAGLDGGERVDDGRMRDAFEHGTGTLALEQCVQ